MKKKRKKRSEGYFKRNYSESWNYIKESKNFIYIIIGLFLIFILIGFFIPVPKNLLEQILKFIQELFEKTQGMNVRELISFIFLNNLKSSFMGMIFGFVFGIFPLISTISNGYLLGFVSSISVESQGISILLRLFPHGIFELPALFISLGLGLKFGTFIFQKEKFNSFRRYFYNSLRVFFFIVLPLLIIAAIIEGSFIFLFK